MTKQLETTNNDRREHMTDSKTDRERRDNQGACHLKMRGDRKIDLLTQGRRSIIIGLAVSNVNCKPTTTPSITPH